MKKLLPQIGKGAGYYLKPFCPAEQEKSCEYLRAFYSNFWVCKTKRNAHWENQKPCEILNTLELWNCWDGTLITLVCTQMILPVTKGKCLHRSICLKMDLSPQEFQVIAGIHLKPSETRSFARIREIPKGPHCRNQRLPPADTEGIVPFNSP